MFGVPTSQVIPRNYREARDFFEARRHKHNNYRRLPCGNTEVTLYGWVGEDPIYSIKLYATDIIIYYPDGSVKLDAYDSVTTNSRRIDAGAPVIRGAKAMGVPKADRLDHETRWDITCGLYPYGIPAVEIVLDPQGRVSLIDGVPEAEYTEHVVVPDVEAQKQRRRVLRRTRQLLTPWAQAIETIHGNAREVSGIWSFDGMDLEMWLEAIDKGKYESEDAAIERFVQQYWTGAYRWDAKPPLKALDGELTKLQPGKNKLDRQLWDTVEVHPSKLPELLG